MSDRCFRCGDTIPDTQVHYDAQLMITLCEKRCAGPWQELRGRHNKEEQEFLQALGKGKK